MERTIGDSLMERKSLLKSNSGSLGINLGAVVYLDVVNKHLPSSSLHFHGGHVDLSSVTGHDLAAPRPNVFSLDLDVSSQDENLSSEASVWTDWRNGGPGFP